MSQSKLLFTPTNLNSYGDEAIHIPGSIQPHGILLALEDPDLKILQVSNNVDNFLGIHPQELLGKSLEYLFGPRQINSLKNCFSKDFESINPLKISFKKSNTGVVFNGTIHRSDKVWILELEPRTSRKSMDFFEFSHLTKPSINKLENTLSLNDLCQTVVQEVRKLTKFDRVMLYQFEPDGSGVVMAEEKSENLSSYLGLHYPALDIPKSARQLFRLNCVRIIPNIYYQPAELIPLYNPITNRPLDLSLSILRSASLCHLDYLGNMGVTASMVISLVKDKKLWGLIACHHYSVKYITYEILTICELLGKLMSLELVSKENNEDLEYKMQIQSTQSKLIESVSKEENLVDGLVKFQSDLLNLTSASGAAIYWDSHLTTVGETPQKEKIQSLLEWLNFQFHNDVFSTDALPKLYPAAAEFKDVASGLLALSISKIQNGYILWFRPERLHTVSWGGNPGEGVELSKDGSVQLSPRTSFELWKETVRLKSLPWKKYEIDAVAEFKNTIVELVLRRADELAKINVELERSNSELDAFAYIASHDLKEPLRGIYNYSSFLIEDYADVLNQEGTKKLQTLMRLTHRMEDLIESLLHFSRLGRIELSLQEVDLNKLVQSVIDMLTISLRVDRVDIRMPRPLPVIQCDRVQVSEVFSNLISNAIKYNDRLDKWVEIGFLDSTQASPQKSIQDDRAKQPPIFYVRDNGIGIREKHQETIFRIFKRLHVLSKYGGGTGAGLTIAKKIVERHGGQIWVESTYGEGSTFYFTLHS